MSVVGPRCGAFLEEGGCRFTVHAPDATGVTLELFADAEGRVPSRRQPLRPAGGGRWSARVPGVAPGQIYAWRVDGPYRPQHGHRFNPAKLLVDPWAHAVTGELRHRP